MNFKKLGRLLRGGELCGIVAAILTAPFYLILGLIASMADRFSDFSILLGYMPFYFGEYVRYIYYRVFLKNVGWGTVFKFGSFVQYRESSIGYRCLTGYFNAVGLVEIGDDVLCGGYINFTSGLRQHSFNAN